MNILLTGGAGFIGGHTAKALVDQGHQLTIIDNFNDYYSPELKEDRLRVLLDGSNHPLYRIDISSKDELWKVCAASKFDAVCHLAAQAGVRYSLENPVAYIQSNIVGTHTILEACRTFGIPKLVFASTSSVYGANEKVPFVETDSTDHPISVYGATKKSAEVLAYAYHHLFGLHCYGLRFFTVYGPWGRPDMAYFKFAAAIAAGRPIEVYNNGNMKRDFTYIDDIVSGIVSALERCEGFELINLGNSEPVELETFITYIEQGLGRNAVKNYLPMQQGDFLQNHADVAKAKTLLGFEPKTPLAEGMESFISWYKDYYHV